MAKNLSEVFRETNELLWDGETYPNDRTGFICTEIFNLNNTNFKLKLQAKNIILKRLGYCDVEVFHTVETWLHCNGICKFCDQTPTKIQKYRKAWLTELEKEFKNK